MKRRFSLLLAAVLAFSPCIASASNPIETQQYAPGQSVAATDLGQDLQSGVFNVSGLLSYALLGSQNALPAANPLTATLSGSAMTFSIGGGGQMVIAQDSASGGSGNPRIIDSCPFQTITIPANSTGSPRTDTLSIQYQEAQTNPHTVPFSSGGVQTVYNLLESCVYNYGTATSSAPANYVAFAHFVVPSGATSASQAAVTYLFPTMAAQIRSLIGGVTSSINGLQGAVTLAGGNGILVNSSGNTITVTQSTPTSVANGGTGTSVPGLSNGTNTTVSGSFPFEAVNVVPNPTFSGLLTASGGINASALIASTNSAAGFQVANSISGSHPTGFVGNGGFTVGGVTDSALGIYAQGYANLLAVDGAGNIGVAGNLNALGAVTSPTILTAYANGTALTSSPHIETFTGSISATTITINFAKPYAAAPVCTASINGAGSHAIYVQNPTTTSVQLYDGASDLYYMTCTGQ